MTYATVTSPAVGDLTTAAWGANVSDDVNVLVSAAPSSILPGTVVASASSNATATSTGATEALHTGLAISPTTVTSGRNYWVEVFGRCGYSTTAGLCGVVVHASQSAITTGSPVVAEGHARMEIATPNGAFDMPIIRYLWTPGASGTWNLQVGVKTIVGAGNSSFGLGAMNAILVLTAA